MDTHITMSLTYSQAPGENSKEPIGNANERNAWVEGRLPLKQLYTFCFAILSYSDKTSLLVLRR